MFGEQCLAMLGAEWKRVVGLGRLLGAGLLEQKETGRQESVRRRWGGCSWKGGEEGDQFRFVWMAACPPKAVRSGTSHKHIFNVGRIKSWTLKSD